MHFIIRHWHAVENTDEGIESNQNFVVVEGYIVPKENEGNYDFYLKDEKSGITKIDKGDTSGIGNIEPSSGTITIPIECIKEKSGELAEHFSGISISAGHRALDSEDKENSIKISYQKNVHLVKAHIFYTDEKITVYGSGQDDGVFGTSEGTKDAHQDTSWIYTYKTSNGTHKAGDVVTKEDGKKPVVYGEELPNGLTEENVQKTKVYNTIEGLHTDKTASVVDDNKREFNIDLESWYSGAPLADIGLVLDASGSMGFTSDNLKRININDLELSEEAKKDFEAKELKKSNYPDGSPTNEEWLNKIFLTEDDINLMLNPHNTDNSKLSASDYSYFIFDPRTTVNEYVPLGYWDGSVKGVKDKLIGYYDFKKGTYDDNSKRDWLKNSVTGKFATLVNQIKTSEIENKDFSFEKAELPQNWTTYKGIKMKDGSGFNIKNDEQYGEKGVGILLDAKPTSNNFTISFSIKKDSTSKENSENQKYTDILYVGNKNKKSGDTYYRSFRDGKNSGAFNPGSSNSSNRFKGYKYESSDKELITNINSVFSNGDAQIITLVFENGKVTSYFKGEKNNDVTEENNINLSGNDIIFKGFDNGYDGADLYVDNIAVFDDALTADEVKDVESIIKSEDEKYIVCNECFYDECTEDSIGVVSNYFVGLDGGTPGWYYVNYDSELEKEYFEENIQSCKRYWGIPKNGVDKSKNETVTYTDKIHGDNDDSKDKDRDTGFTYEPEKSTPIEFYIDSSGYLRCFFTSSTRQETAHASYVYYKDDSNYVKTEALQRALGSFSTMLEDVSPESKISAVRFSSDKIKEDQLDKLVLLDWTNDPIEEQDIMSLNRGEGGTVVGTSSSPDSEDKETKSVEQYNYGLTGGTDTLTGLQAFQKFLSSNADESADKYLIIFTDGKDSTDTPQQEESKKIATELKEKGYTIFGVMLTGGSVEFSENPDSDYQQAKKFLLTLVGNSETDANSEVKTTSEKEDDSETVEDYFYSTVEADNSIDALTEIFTDQILTRITYNLYDYNVEDYIDPRFDLVSAENNIYNLNADGKITIKKPDGSTSEYDLKNGSASEDGDLKEDDENKKYLTITLSNDSKIEKSARNARLYYDDSKKMYFLKWVEQTIPGCIPNANYLSVWNAKFTIKAKDDFIGGNAVLTNGNEKDMNWVYSDEDKDKSSGVNDAVLPKEETDTSEGETVGGASEDPKETEDKDDKYPSKGFPRVTVNVPPEKNTFSEEQLIYMGEKIDKEELSEKLMQNTYKKLENTNLKYYIEYLSRYANKNTSKVSLEDLKKDLKQGKTVTIPYYYLPNSSKTTLTGGNEHEEDLVGILEYKVVPEKDDYPKDGIIKDRIERKLVFTVKYIPLNNDENLEYEKENASEELTKLVNKTREKNNETLVTEDDYKWDKDYKPAVGDEISKEDLVTGTHTTKDVSGEIALQLVLTPDIQDVIGDDELIYKIDLMREYDNKDKQKVGTFTATYKKENMPLAQPKEAPTTPPETVPSTEEVKDNTYQLDDKGNITILAKIEYDEEYMKTNGLPIGTYTLENPKITDFENLKFKLPNVITGSSQYTSELFSLGSDNDKLPLYLASFKENDKIILGDKDTSESTTYTDLRFGLMRVTPITKFELPKTGKTSLIKICGAIAILTTFGFIILVKRRKDL